MSMTGIIHHEPHWESQNINKDVSLCQAQYKKSIANSDYL